MASRLPLFLAELKRRKVYHVAVSYVLVGTAVIGTADAALPDRLWGELLQVPVVVLVALGLPIALVLAWAYEVRPDKSPTDTHPSPLQHPDGRRSIVVLPFDNMSPDPGDAYFSDGLTEEIITNLSGIRSLRVISRSSAMVLKGTRKNVRTIGRDLDVQYVLEGSVRKAGDKLRITAQLIDATHDEHLWAEKHDGVLVDVFGMQERVARAIVDSLRLTLSPEESSRLTARPLDDVRIYECYLKSREEFWKWSEEGLENALTIIRNGLEILGEHELLYIALGTVHAQYVHFGEQKDESHLRAAESCIDKVFTFNPRSSQGHYLKGFTQWWRGEQTDAVRFLKKALELDPDHSDALVWLGWVYAISGPVASAHPLFERALKVDPLNFSVHGHVSGLHLMEGDFATAVASLLRALKLVPGNPWVRVGLAFWCVYDERRDEARQYIDLLERDTPESVWTQLGLFLRHSLDGDKDLALRAVTERLKGAMRWNELYPLLMADCYAMIDERDEAIDWVEEAVRWGCINYPYLHEHAPCLEAVRREDRFRRLMVDVKNRWESFEA